MSDYVELKEKAKLVRKCCLTSTTEAESGHPTSCLSAADLTAVLFDKYFTYDIYNPLNLFNDRFVLSKGHAAPLLYTLFGMAGAYSLDELQTLRKYGSRFEGHPVPAFAYAEAATGSLGQGVSVAAGLALIAKRENLSTKSFVLTGDGELAEGQVWEAANFASYHKLDNLIVMTDINRLAQSGETMFGSNAEEYAKRFEAFGFEVVTINGHDLAEIDNAFEQAVNNTSGKPFAIIAKTVKGKGISFLEDKEGWHGKALKQNELQQALNELGNVNDNLRFILKKPLQLQIPPNPDIDKSISTNFKKNVSYATREIFGEILAQCGQKNKEVYVLDADVKNSTFTQDFLKLVPERFIECFIAEQNMVSVAAGLSRVGKIPVVATFGAFLTRAADQIRMARVSEANIKFVGSHVGVAIGEDGPSQMALEDIAMFGAIPDTVILQPADAVSAAMLVPIMLSHRGFVYMRTLRPKTPLLYDGNKIFQLGGSAVLRQSGDDELTIAATGITVFEALKAAAELSDAAIQVRVVDCYSICPVDAITLARCLNETKKSLLIVVEDHYAQGGLGDFILEALAGNGFDIIKMAVTHISQSGSREQLLRDAEIDASAIIKKIKELL